MFGLYCPFCTESVTVHEFNFKALLEYTKSGRCPSCQGSWQGGEIACGEGHIG